MDEARAALARALSESERRRADLEELLHRERRERAQAVADAEARGAILGVLARELRGPMNAALSWTRFVRKELLAQSARDHALALVERDLAGSLGLIDDFLDVGGLGAAERRTTDRIVVADLLAAAVARFDARAQERHVAVDLQLATGGLTVSGDLVRVEHVVDRLVSAAIELTFKRTTLRLRAAATDDGAVEIEAVFEPMPGAPAVLPRAWDDVAAEAGTPSSAAVSLFLLHKLAEAQRGRAALASAGGTLRLGVALPTTPVGIQTAEALGVQAFDLLGHELRSPLQVFTVSVDLLRTRIRDSADEVPREWIAKQLDMLERAAERLHAVADRAAEMSSVLGRNIELKRDVIELSTVVDNVLARMEPELAWAGCRVEKHVADGYDSLGCWDSVHLETVIGNLLSNAMKYGARKPILVALSGDETSVTLSVHDQGPGIAPEDRARLFERFFRGASTKQLPGLGLGLAVTKRLVEAHLGRITLEPAPEGACFRVVLPRGVTPFARRALAGSPSAET